MSRASAAAAHRLARHAERHHVIVLEGASPGHIYPTLPLVAAMRAGGSTVTYFIATTADESVANAVKSAGASLRFYREGPDHLLDNVTFRQRVVSTELRWLPPLIEDLRTLSPPATLLIYDAFITIGPATATLVHLPAVGIIPHCGPGWLAPIETDAACAELESHRLWLKQRCGLDLLTYGHPPCSWYCNSCRLNIVLTIDALFSPPSEAQQQRHCGDVTFKCVGSLLAGASAPRPSLSLGKGAMEHQSRQPFPIGQIRAAREAGQRIVLLALGTLVTTSFWQALPSDSTAAVTGGAEVTAASGGVVSIGIIGENPEDSAPRSGRGFAHLVWTAAMEALGGLAGRVLVLLVVGPRTDALDRLPPLPRHFLAFPWVPQLELLPLCSAFITHGGMGSVMEAVLSRCPMVVVPVFADQLHTAEAVGRSGLGVGFKEPWRSLTAEALRGALEPMLEGAAEPAKCRFRQALQRASAPLEAEGQGAKAAVELIWSAASRFREHFCF